MSADLIAAAAIVGFAVLLVLAGLIFDRCESADIAHHTKERHQ